MKIFTLQFCDLQNRVWHVADFKTQKRAEAARRAIAADGFVEYALPNAPLDAVPDGPPIPWALWITSRKLDRVSADYRRGCVA